MGVSPVFFFCRRSERAKPLVPPFPPSSYFSVFNSVFSVSSVAPPEHRKEKSRCTAHRHKITPRDIAA